MNMEFKRKLPIPAEIKEMYPVSEEGIRQKNLMIKNYIKFLRAKVTNFF